MLGIVYNADSTPWCGLFVANCMRAAGIDLGKMKIGVRASEWATWGKSVPLDMLAPGAILVFKREGGAHVGFYISEDLTRFDVLGGNQGDKVTIAPIEKARCIAARWPADRPHLGHPIFMASSAASSRNETRPSATA